MNGIAPVIPTITTELIAASRELGASLLAQAEVLSTAYRLRQEAHRTQEEMRSLLEEQVNDFLVDAEFRGSTLKEGPLAGLARTSDAYKSAVRKVRAELLANPLASTQSDVRRSEDHFLFCDSEYESAKIRFHAMRVKAELDSSAMRAMSA